MAVSVLATGNDPAEHISRPAERVRLAVGPLDLHRIGRLRYDLFVRRDGKNYGHADSSRGTLIEPIDDVSDNFLVEAQGEIRAAVRLTLCCRALEDRHLRLAIEHAGLTEAMLAGAAINSRLAIQDGKEGSLLLTQLFRKVYRAGVERGARHCVLAARPSLSALFQRFGFKPVRAYADPVAGPLVTHVLDAFDRDHLASVRSPYLRALDDLSPTNRN